MEKYVFFWRNKSPFSQWHKSRFEVAGTHYTSAEQYMMQQKALLMGDTKMASLIMETNNTAKQKGYGRQVSPFNEELWNQQAKNVVYIANKAKFAQNKHMQDELLATVGKLIVEASPFDTIWGIGLGPDDPNRFDESKWRGTNWLGEILTELRIELIGE